jgi:hypothetical protein
MRSRSSMPSCSACCARNAEKCQLSRDEAVQYLVEILKTPIGEVTADHRLAQFYDAKSGKIELPNKLGAMQLLAKMCGWQAPGEARVRAWFQGEAETHRSHRSIARTRSGTQQSVCRPKLKKLNSCSGRVFRRDMGLTAAYITTFIAPSLYGRFR